MKKGIKFQAQISEPHGPVPSNLTAPTGSRTILLNHHPGQSSNAGGRGRRENRETHQLPDEMGQENDKETLEMK